MKFKQIGYENVTSEDVDNFLKGSNSIERVIKIETDYRSDHVYVVYRDENGAKKRKKCDFYPFVWATAKCARRLFDGDREKLKKVMLEDSIGVKGLRTDRQDHTTPERMKNGYRIMFFAKKPMSYNDFLSFFKKGGMPIYPDEKDKNYGEKEYIAVSPVEQYMIETGTRMFRGYENYDELVRLLWDIETEGLDPEIHRISQIGIRTNKGFEKIITVGPTDIDEDNAIFEFFSIIKKLSPDVISGHNSENFDWNFIEKRLLKHGHDMREISEAYFPQGVYKKDKMEVLKLGGEMEYYRPTIMWGYNITDSLFAVRRAQALDSNMKQATLKYVTKYAGLVKSNRVYVPGKIINETWLDQDENYAFNDENGNWFKVDDRLDKISETDGEITDNKTGEKFKRVTGRYIVQRYLLDDLYETDKVELQYNQSNFLVGKMLPVSFEKVCTMGTAAIWKYIMLAWSFEQELAIPELTQSRSFTGGLSRLLKVGWVDRIVKLDYNSLYPSILLTFNIKTPIDIMDTMSVMLEYILTQREYFKGLKGMHGKKANELKERLEREIDALTKALINQLNELIKTEKAKKNQNDILQLPFKVFGNGFFGSYGSGSIFPWSDIECAEETTCTGRQCLRLMISHFTNLGYEPIVGDTDGFNFQMPMEFRYKKEKPYISNGAGRNTVKDKAYVGVEADVAEFEDMYFHSPFNGGTVNKMGLGIDEFCDACIQFSRKNYADLMPDGSIKLVGNSIKSKKMPIYIEKFLNEGIRMLLEGRGKDFLELYYDYIEKIYNMRIPLKDIASVGKIKTTIKTYKESCKQTTKSGSKKARQAWYELAIKYGMNPDMGTSIYYINTGKKKSSSDVQRLTHYYEYRDGEKVEITKELEKEYKQMQKDEKARYNFNMLDITKAQWWRRNHPNMVEEDELVFNCVMLSNAIVEDEEDHYCDDDFEYNVDKYIDMFNKRITPLLVCFSKNIREKYNEKGKLVSNILITNPKDRKVFTEEESRLSAGEPYEKNDQDTYEALMTMEDKEIKFWLSVDREPPFTKECGMNWEDVKNDYIERMRVFEDEVNQRTLEAYRTAIESLKPSEVDTFISEGKLPVAVAKIAEEDVNSTNLISKSTGIILGTIMDIIDFNGANEESSSVFDD